MFGIRAKAFDVPQQRLAVTTTPQAASRARCRINDIGAADAASRPPLFDNNDDADRERSWRHQEVISAATRGRRQRRGCYSTTT
jgi:hypothetical protein